MQAGTLLGGVGIQVAPHGIEAGKDVEGLALLGAFEQHVLQKMGQSSLMGPFVPTPSIHHKTGMRDFSRGHLLVNEVHAIGKRYKQMIHGCKDNHASLQSCVDSRHSKGRATVLSAARSNVEWPHRVD